MDIGIFSRTFVRPTVEQVFGAVVMHGLTAVQFNYKSAGLDELPTAIDDDVIAAVRTAAQMVSIDIASVSGTFNMVHPDASVRAAGLEGLRAVAASAPKLGCKVVTLCTGTRHAANMWRAHPDNESEAAWRDLLAVMEDALTIAADCDVVLGIEPEVSNVVSSPLKARRLLDELQSPHLGIIMDGANVFPAGTLDRQHEILDEAFDLLGDDIVLAHAKDIAQDGEAGHEAAGTGLLDYPHYISLLAQSTYRGPLILHSLTETQTPNAVTFVRDVIATVETKLAVEPDADR